MARRRAYNVARILCCGITTEPKLPRASLSWTIARVFAGFPEIPAGNKRRWRFVYGVATAVYDQFESR